MTATFVRRAGQGPAVVCLHANAASSSQWRGLMDRLSTRHTVVAPDAYGSGKGPAWTEPRLMDLEDEAALIRPLLDGLDGPLCFVGHSHGAAVALLLALEMHRHQPGRVAALALYEPTLFAVALQLDRHDPDVAGIQDAVRRSVALTAAGDPDRGAGAFIDYWMGDGAWAATPEARKPAIIDAARLVDHWRHALCESPLRAEDFKALDVPVFYGIGAQTRPSARRVAELLTAALPNVTVQTFADAGHMGPITHADAVNAAVDDFLRQVSAR